LGSTMKTCGLATLACIFMLNHHAFGARPYARRRGMLPAVPIKTLWEEKGTAGPLPSTANCTIFWLEQPLDHFSFSLEGGVRAGDAKSDVPSSKTFMERYYVYDKFWKKGKGDDNAPIFFYAGNEADVGLYVNATGLMWENAKAFGALLVPSTAFTVQASPRPPRWSTARPAAVCRTMIAQLRRR